MTDIANTAMLHQRAKYFTNSMHICMHICMVTHQRASSQCTKRLKSTELVLQTKLAHVQVAEPFAPSAAVAVA